MPPRQAASGFELHPTGFPGIGVEITPEEARTKIGSSEKSVGDGYVDYIKGLLGQVAGNPVGSMLLGEYNPESNAFSQVDNGAEMGASGGIYSGFTVIIRHPLFFKATKIPKKEARWEAPLKTDSFRGRDPSSGKKTFDDKLPQIPCILLFDPNRETYDDGSTKIEATGVTAHRDMPVQESPWPLHVALYHEFCHAFLIQIQLTGLLNDSLEEEFVSGLHRAKSWFYCENRYRATAGLPLRKSYLAVNLAADQGVGGVNWWAGQRSPDTLLEALAIDPGEKPWKKRLGPKNQGYTQIVKRLRGG